MPERAPTILVVVITLFFYKSSLLFEIDKLLVVFTSGLPLEKVLVNLCFSSSSSFLDYIGSLYFGGDSLSLRFLVRSPIIAESISIES